MKISNSKKQLAKIISENGGWPCDAEYSSQDGSDGQVSFYKCGTPIYNKLAKIWNAPGSCVHMYGSRIEGLGCVGVIKNFHQTILSRDEYFHLYPAPDADGWIEWKGGECPVKKGTLLDLKHRDGELTIGVVAGEMRNLGERDASSSYWINDDHEGDIIAYRLHKPEQQKSTAVGDDETNLAAKEELEALEFSESPEQRAKLAKIYAPSIEQLAADYRAKLAIAQQAQEEADSHRCGAESALERLIAAGKALGLVLSVAAPEPELVITDWRDLRSGDIIEATCYGDERDENDWPGGWANSLIGGVFSVLSVDDAGIHVDEESPLNPVKSWDTGKSFKFIRRPAKEADNA